MRILLHDISERRRAEEIQRLSLSLLKTEAFSRSVIDSVPACIAVLDRSGNIMAVNQPWTNHAHDKAGSCCMAKSGAEVGMNYLDMCRQQLAGNPDEYVQRAIDGIEAVLAGHRPAYSMEWPCKPHCGTEWFHMMVSPLGPDIQGVVVSHTDISERKVSDRALAESEARFSLFMNTLPAIAFIKNARGEVVYANRHFEQTFHLGNWQGATSADMYPPDVAERLDVADRKALAAGYLVSEELFVRPDGVQAVYQDHKFAIPQSDDSPLLGCIALDITEHKRVETAFREGQEHLSQALSIAKLGSWRADLVTDEVHWSAEQYRMLGYEPGSVVPSYQAFLDRVVPEDRPQVVSAMNDSLLAGGAHHMEYRILLPDGSRRDMLADGLVELDASGKPIVIAGTVLDITDRKRIADELLAAKQAAEKANHAKSKFLAAASHDLRQPLAAMAMYVGVLQSGAPPTLQTLVEKVANCCTGLSELLNDLLEVSKLDAEVVVPRPQDFSIDAFMHSLLALHAPEAARRGLYLRWRDCRKYACTDPILLQRIMGNLLSNAIRYTHHGGILVALRRHDSRLWLEVWDTGIGIAADKTGIIFEEFSQVDATATNPGSGLGLAILAKTAALLGLEVRLRSRPGRGSMFAVELPAGSAVHEPASAESPLQGRHLHIALVENNAMVLDAITCALEAAGHVVTAAPDGDRLLAGLQTSPPDIIIADYRLSARKTGYEVIEAVRARHGATLPALIMTGDTDPALIREMSRRGIAIQYKPLQLASLLACAMQQVEGRES